MKTTLYAILLLTFLLSCPAADADNFRVITFKNNAGYVASLEVSWQYYDQFARVPGTKTEKVTTSKIVVGAKEEIQLASYIGMSDLTIKVNGVGTLSDVEWDSTGSETLTLDRRFHRRACFEAKGTIFNPSADYCDGGAPMIKKQTSDLGEQACFNKVQDKVAWSTAGDNRWNPENVKALCRGVKKSGVDSRINCFRQAMPQVGWSAAINQCS